MAMTRGRKIALIIAGLLLAGVLVVVLIGALIYISLKSGPDVANNSVLVLRVEGALPDYSNADPAMSRILGGNPNSFTSLLTQLRKAKADKRIGAVLLDIGFLGTGWAKSEELRDAVADFRRSGKPIYAYMEVGSDKELFVATAAEKVYVAPIGDLFINGLAAEAMFFRGTFDKLGIYWDGYQIGKYKTAPERFTRKEMSEGEREQLDALLDGIFNRYTAVIAEARGKSVEDIKTMIDNAPHNAVAAAQAGLIDGALYRTDVENELKKRLGYKEDEKLKRVTQSEYQRVTQESLGLNEGEKIAIVFASGPINLGKSNDGTFGGEQTIGSDTVVKAINDARDDKSVKAIVLRVDSPGGGIYPSDLIWKAVEEAKAKKPVVISMSDLAASGGYYVSMGANRVLAQPLTLTGSIGVFGYKPVMKEFYDWVGVSAEYLTRGKNAGLFRETERFSDEERKQFERLINHYYWGEFIPKAAQGRGRDTEYLHSVAQGRVWTGEQAKERGLIDEFGGLDRAVEVAKGLADIPADKGVRRVVFPTPRTFFQQLFGGERDAGIQAEQQREAFINSMPKETRRTLRLIARFEKFNQGEALAILPFELDVK